MNGESKPTRFFFGVPTCLFDDSMAELKRVEPIYEFLRGLNSKSDTRNPKQIQNPKLECSKRITRKSLNKRAQTTDECVRAIVSIAPIASYRFCHWPFGHLNLFRISDFVFRICSTFLLRHSSTNSPVTLSWAISVFRPAATLPFGRRFRVSVLC